MRLSSSAHSAYYHELFLRGHPELATRIHRMKLKGIGQGRHRTNAELEPNFYRMKPVGDASNPVDSALDVIQHQASAAVAPSASASNVAHNSASPSATSVNVLQLFGGGNANDAFNSNVNAAAAANQANNGAGRGFQRRASSFTDVHNLFFLAGNGGNNGAAGDVFNQGNSMGGQQDSFHQNSQQGGASASASASSAPLLANTFGNQGNAAGANAGMDGFAAGGNNSSTNRGQGNDDSNQWSASSLFANASNNNLGPLFQNADANLVTTASLMQYMADSNSDSAGQSPPGAAGGAQTSSQQQSQLHQQQGNANSNAWAGLGNATDALTMSGNLHHGATTGMNNSNSNNDLANTFRLDGPSLRRMSAAAVSTLLGGGYQQPNSFVAASAAAFGNNSGNVNSSNNANGFSLGDFDSNSNLFLLSQLQQQQQQHQRRSSSSNNLLQHLESSSAADPPGSSFLASQTLNRLAANSSGNASTTNQLQHETPASQQLAFLQQQQQQQQQQQNNPAGGGSSFLFHDLFGGNRASAAAASRPSLPGNHTFLDSACEPIPIKEEQQQQQQLLQHQQASAGCSCHMTSGDSSMSSACFAFCAAAESKVGMSMTSLTCSK